MDGDRTYGEIARLNRRGLLATFVAGAGALVAACSAPAPAASPKAAPAKPAESKPAPTAPGAAQKAPATAKDKEKVVLRLDAWTAGHQAPFFLGKDRGIYDDVGIDLTIGEGGGSSATVQAIAAKQDPFGYVGALPLVTAIGKGVPVKSVATFMQKPGDGIVFLESANIKKPQDLEGKRVAVSASGSGPVFYKAFVKANKLDESKIDRVTIEITQVPPAILSGQVDAGLDWPMLMIAPAEKAGKKIAWLNYPDWGVQVLGHGIVVNADTIKERPDTVKRFIQASSKAWDLSAQNPKAAFESLKKLAAQSKELDAQEKVAELTLQLLHTKASQGKPAGWTAPEDWQQTVDTLVDGGVIPEKLALDRVFTNEFF